MSWIQPGRPARGFASYPAWAKLSIWVAAVVVLACVVQGVSWLAGLDFDILSQSKAGRAVLLLLAVGSLLAMMTADRRPAADYGLVIGESWRRQWFGGLAVGLGSYAAYCLLAVGAGALTVLPAPSPYRWVSAGLGSLTAIPLAVSQQLIFSGYLLSLFGRGRARAAGVLVVAVLFALASKLSDPGSLLAWDSLPLVTGMLLIQALLGVLRVRHNTVLVPAGLLAGWVFARRLIRKAGLLGVTGSADWLAPGGDPRQSPLVWLMLTGAIGWLAWAGRHAVVPLPSGQPAIAASFKRIAPFSNLSMLAPLDVWLGRLWQARFAVGPAYLPRMLAIVVFSTLNTVVSLPERLVMGWVLRKRSVADPVFIVGVHRSGTTHLHNMLALDPHFVTPRTYQVMNPFGFLFSGWLFVPLMAAFAPWKRPMDGVRFSMLTPQEDEFALAGMSGMSPYWGLTFPRQAGDYDRFIDPVHAGPHALRSWKKRLINFLRALTFWSARRPLLKNPYHTARLKVLCEMFPRARFIHIHRQPFAVYRSNLHMQREGHCLYQLQDAEEKAGYAARFLDNYLGMERAFYSQAKRLPPDRVAEVCFEELEKDPRGEIARLYAQLQLPLDVQFEQRLERYLEGLRGYEKNRLQRLDEGTRRGVHAHLAELFDRWGYDAEGEKIAPRGASGPLSGPGMGGFSTLGAYKLQP